MDNDQQDPETGTADSIQTAAAEAPLADAAADRDPVTNGESAGASRAGAAGDGVADEPSDVMTVDAVMEATTIRGTWPKIAS